MFRSCRIGPAIVVVANIFAATLLVTTAGAQVPDADLPVADSKTGHFELVVPTNNGKIVWKDVADSLATALRLDPPTVARWFPTGSLDLHKSATVLVLFGIDVALGDAVSLAVVRDQLGNPALRLRCDRQAIRFLASSHEAKPTRLEPDVDWTERAANQPLVVCLHGMRSDASRFAEFRSFLRQHGYATAVVSYDDHQSIVDSAAQVSQLARQVFAPGTQPKLVLVGYSMGGLVAREWTENPDLRNENIVGLITAGTPHRGSNWASLPPLLDFFGVGKFDASDLVDVLLHQPSAPGMRELAPGSSFLTELAARPRRPDVRYTTIVGTGSPVSDVELAKLQNSLQQLDAKSKTVRLLRPRIKPLLESFDELARGKGDGVVAVESAKLTGVDDVVTVELSHFELFRSGGKARPQPVWSAILKRL